MPFFCYLLIQIQDLSQDTVKFSRKSQGLYFLYFLGAYFWPGLSTEGYFRFKIDWMYIVKFSNNNPDGQNFHILAILILKYPPYSELSKQILCYE